ncbi:MAG: VWA domain-containing protein [Flavobacteriales bacterium]|nr:VWA domain-containing protein [Flavobacteriales bacterium]
MKHTARYPLGPMALVVLLVELLAGGALVFAGWFMDRHVPAFSLERPHYPWALAALPVLTVLYLLDLALRNRRVRLFAIDRTAARMMPAPSAWRSVVRFLLVRHGLSLVAVAAAGPRLGTGLEEVRSTGMDVVIAVDVSNSMLCQDLKPDRMTAAKRALARFIDGLQGDRLGLVVFAGEAYVQLPLTVDRSAARLFLNSIGPNMVATQGTSIGAAIRTALSGFGEQSTGSKAILVITDGEDHEEEALDAAREAAAQGVVVSTIGMGTVQGGPIPVMRDNVIAGFRKDRSGSVVMTRLNEEVLRGVAEAGGGRFVRATSTDAGLGPLLDDLRGMERTEVGTFQYSGHEDRAHLFIALACVFFFAAAWLGEHRVAFPGFKLRPERTALWGMLPALLLVSCGDIADRSLRRGNTLLDAGDLSGAIAAYGRVPEDGLLRYNLGTTELMRDSLASAIEALQVAATLSGDTGLLRAFTWHNLGHAMTRGAWQADSLALVLSTPPQVEGGSIAERVRQAVRTDSMLTARRNLMQTSDSLLNSALVAYKQALRRAPTDEDSRADLALVMHQLEQRRRNGRGGGGGNTPRTPHSAFAAQIIARVDSLVDQYHYDEALQLLQQGLQLDTTLKQDAEYAKKLDVVTQAAQAQ